MKTRISVTVEIEAKDERSAHAFMREWIGPCVLMSVPCVTDVEWIGPAGKPDKGGTVRAQIGKAGR
jgi:hypothetical protein